MSRCDFYGQSTDEVQCPSCGSRSFDSVPASQIVKGEPFHYRGYVVWCLADWAYDTAEYLFYLGDRLVERLTVTQEALRVLGPEHCDAMPFIWDLFLLAQGEKEVLRVVEQNTIKPAIFEITVRQDVEEHNTIGLSYSALRTAIATGGKHIGYYKGRQVTC